MSTTGFWTLAAPTKYAITVNGGVSCLETAVEGAEVAITADAPAACYVFSGWTVNSGGVSLADSSAPETTFTMGTANVEVTANFVQDKILIPEVAITDIDGPIVGNEPDRTWAVPEGANYTIWEEFTFYTELGGGHMTPGRTYAEGETYEFWVFFSPDPGYAFPTDSTDYSAVLETCGGSIDAALVVTAPGKMLMAKFSFEAQLSAVEYSVTVNGGTSSVATVVEGANVTVTADAPATGFEFSGWTVVSGGIALVDSSAAETTFTMGNADVELTANYTELPPEEVLPPEFLGSDLEWTKGSDTDLPLVADSEFAGTLTVKVDGVVLDASEYELSEDVTTIILKTALLESLALDSHTLVVTSEHGDSSVDFTVIESPVDPVEPVDPVDPTDPVDPVDPTDPTKPTVPVDPKDSDTDGKTDTDKRMQTRKAKAQKPLTKTSHHFG